MQEKHTNNISNVISQITGVKEAYFESESFNSSLKPGEYVAVYWVEGSYNVVWFLGKVEGVGNTVKVIHLKRSDKKRT